MSITIAVLGGALENIGEQIPEGESTLEKGYVCDGNALGSTGSAYFDATTNADYGHGRRYEMEETPFITRVPSKS